MTPTMENGNSDVVRRRLAAIVFADVVGFSRLIEQDDVRTTRTWRALQHEVIKPKATAHRGRLLRVLGDGLFLEFSSAVDAVSWAQDVQAEISRRDQGTSAAALPMRMGINVEDVVDDGADLHGDGVNIAARIQQLARPGEIVITSAVRDYVRNKLELKLTDLGDRDLKNISRPIRIYRVERCGSHVGPPVPSSAALSDHRPSIAVLPLRNIGGNPEDEYFGEGITEDIIGALARNRSLLVIARHSTLPYRNRSMDVAQIASELGVRYVLEGSVRRLGDRLRIAVGLIDTGRNWTMWSEKYDGAVSDLFEFQERIATSIAAVIEPPVYAAEVARVQSKPTESLDSYDCVLRALPLFHSPDERDFDAAAVFLDRAIALDRSYARAWAHKALWHIFRIGEQSSKAGAHDVALAEAAALQAIALDANDAYTLAVAAHVEAFIRRCPEAADGMFDHALRLNPNSALAWGLSAITCCYLGRPEEALARLGYVRRLSPFDPLNWTFCGVAGMAEFMAGRYAPALEWLQKGRHGNPGQVACLRNLAACLALLMRTAEARLTAKELLVREPGFRISAFVQSYPLRRSQDLGRLIAGLRAAGLPE